MSQVSPEKGGKARLRPCMAAKIIFFLSGFEPAAGQSVQLQPAHQATRRVAKPPTNRLRPCMAAKAIFYRVSNLPPGRHQMPPCSCSLPPSPKKGGKASKWPASACCGCQNHFSMALYGRQNHFLSGFEPAARQASNASVQVQPATKL